MKNSKLLLNPEFMINGNGYQTTQKKPITTHTFHKPFHSKNHSLNPQKYLKRPSHDIINVSIFIFIAAY